MELLKLTPPTPPTPQTPKPQGKEAVVEREDISEQEEMLEGDEEIVSHYICSSRVQLQE